MSSSSSGNSSNRVVSLNSLGRNRSPGQRLLGECRDRLVDSLCLWLQEIAAPISEELFVLADSTRDRLLQTRYLDLRADIEKDWIHLVETFRRDLSAEAERCQNQIGTQANENAAPLELPDFEGLKLVDDDDLTEHIVLREFAAQVSETCDEELYTLNRRIAALLGHDEPEENANPLAPPVVCNALSDACSAIGSNAEERLLLLRRLERHLHLGLPPIYQQINAYLIERGILPDLKRSFRKNAVLGDNKPAVSTTSPAPQAGDVSIAAAQSTSPAAATGPGVLEALQRLALARTTQAQLTASGIAGGFNVPFDGTASNFTAGMPMPDGGPATPIDAEAVNRLLLSTLNEIQHTPLPAANTGGMIVNQIRMVRDSENAQNVGGLASVTIDIVAMLFDFIFDDAHVPTAIKALLSRLQIPVLKVAMLNPSFFADRLHPTRRFLGGISGISIRWGSTVDESDPFYRKLAELVQRIQNEFEEDIEVFGTALAELEEFVEENENTENKPTLAAANLAMQHERVAEALEQAERALRTFQTGKQIPALLGAFFETHWVPTLQKIALKNQIGSPEWQSGLDTMQDLLWSIEAKKAPDERLKLISLLPKLLSRINAGLDSIEAPAAQRQEFFDKLVKCHSAALKGEPMPQPVPETEQKESAPVIKPPTEGELQVKHSVDDGIEVEEVVLIGASPVWRADDREIARQVNELKRGDWVDFIEDKGFRNRVRLNWISPQRGIMVFSNNRSAKAISIDPDALARQIRDGKAEIVQPVEVFERALSGALESINVE